MTEPDAGMPAVEPVCIPITDTLYRTLENTWDPFGPSTEWPMSLAGHEVRGKWRVVGLRADYAIAGARTFWVTLEWVDRG